MDVYVFSVDYNAIVVADILDIHKYVMKKNGIVYNVWICKANICFSRMFFDCNVSNINPLKCVSMNNKECKTKLKIININSNEPTLHCTKNEVFHQGFLQ